MIAAPAQDGNIFKQLFVEHWDGFTRVYPRYHTRSYDGLVAKMLRCGHPDKIGSIAYRCLHCGQGQPLVAMSCNSSLCLRCATVYVDNWVSQGSQMRHEGVLYRPSVLTVPASLRQTFYQQAQAVLSPCMRCGARGLADGFSRGRGRARKGGDSVVVQTHGRKGQYTPHLHGIATRGGWAQQAQPWSHLDSVP